MYKSTECVFVCVSAYNLVLPFVCYNIKYVVIRWVFSPFTAFTETILFSLYCRNFYDHVIFVVVSALVVCLCLLSFNFWAYVTILKFHKFISSLFPALIWCALLSHYAISFYWTFLVKIYNNCKIFKMVKLNRCVQFFCTRAFWTQ